MKNLIFTGKFTIDFDKEKDRIHKCFAGEIKHRQLKLIDSFESGNFQDSFKLYDDLPYNNEDECPEQEYVGMWFHNIIDSLTFAKFNVSSMKIENDE